MPYSQASAAPVTAATETVAPALLAWAAEHGRHDLPWQVDPSPYRVWVSEVMLQQTQVATVIPYYERFMGRFPDIGILASAPLDEVLHAWTGLGYYARARNLHRAAQIVVQEHDGYVPEDIEALQSLPGIGRSTAGAILALSRGQRHPILDGNARRVLARYFGVEGDPSGRDTLTRLWEIAEACTPHERVADYTQAVMDLGSGVCLRSRPRCDACPLRTGCAAHRAGRQSELPSPRRRRSRPQRRAVALVVLDREGAFLLQRLPSSGVWGGLWSLPAFESEAKARGWLSLHFPPAPRATSRLPPQQHSFTHFDLALELVLARIDSVAPATNDPAVYRWYDPGSPARFGLSKAVTDLLRHIEGKCYVNCESRHQADAEPDIHRP